MLTARHWYGNTCPRAPRSVEELFRCVQAFAFSLEKVCPQVPGAHVPVYKKHIISFLKRNHRHLYLDFNTLLKDELAVAGGTYPNQWYGASGNKSRGDEDVAAPPPHPMGAPPVPTGSTPDHLCCPITLGLYVDPVVTCSGHTFERQAIESWFAQSATNPLTGEALATTNLVTDQAMRARCVEYVAQHATCSHPCGPRAAPHGRGGRGLYGRGGRGLRGRGGRGLLGSFGRGGRGLL